MNQETKTAAGRVLAGNALPTSWATAGVLTDEQIERLAACVDANGLCKPSARRVAEKIRGEVLEKNKATAADDAPLA